MVPFHIAGHIFTKVGSVSLSSTSPSPLDEAALVSGGTRLPPVRSLLLRGSTENVLLSYCMVN